MHVSKHKPFRSVQFSAFQYILNIVQTSSLSTSQTFSSPQKDTPSPSAVAPHPLPTRSPWPPPICLLSPWICLVWASPVSGHTPRGALCLAPSPGVVFLGFPCVVAGVGASFPYTAGSQSPVCVGQRLRLPADGHWGSPWGDHFSGFQGR